MNNIELTEKLLSQPITILNQELVLIEMMEAQSNDRKVSEEINSIARNEAAMNLSFKNEGQRTASVETQLRDNQQYQTIQKKLLEQDKQIRIASVNLAFHKDLLKSYLAIAGM